MKIATDDTFAGEFNIVGLSQGGLLARYIVEECDMPGKVRNFVTLGTPHMGIDAVPPNYGKEVGEILNPIAKEIVYTDIMQNLITASGYFRNAADFKNYEKYAVFLPKLNNELRQWSQ